MRLRPKTKVIVTRAYSKDAAAASLQRMSNISFGRLTRLAIWSIWCGEPFEREAGNQKLNPRRRYWGRPAALFELVERFKSLEHGAVTAMSTAGYARRAANEDKRVKDRSLR
jgi:hypothetical protein